MTVNRVTSATTLVAPPDASVYRNLRWEPHAAGVEHGAGCDLCADALGLEGATVTFIVEALSAGGWVRIGQAAGVVKDGVARAPLPPDVRPAIGERMRFRITAGGPWLPPGVKLGGPARAPPALPKPAPHSPLFQGATGEAVSDLQQRLAKIGLYQGKVSGRYDGGTAMAVVALQQHAMLTPVNGGMYPACWDALEKMEAGDAKAGQPQAAPPKPGPPKPGPREPAPMKPPLATPSPQPPPQDHPFLFQSATGPAVREVQQRLSKLGLYSGPISGTYSAATAGAVVKLQQQKKLLPVNGGMYAACWDALAQLEVERGHG